MNELYDLAARVSLETTAFSAAAQMAMGVFGRLESAAGRTERAVQTALAGRSTALQAVERATTSLQSAQLGETQALQNHLRITQAYGVGSTQEVASLNRLERAHLSLQNAQLGQAAAANRAANATASYSTAATAATGAATRQSAISRGTGLLVAGAAVTAVGVGLLAFMDSAVKRAMDLQTIMVGIQARTHSALIDPATQGFTAQGGRLQNLFSSIGLTNQMSTGDVAGVAQAASRAGITQMSQLTAMLKPLANYSEVMLRATGADTSESAKTATEFAHLFGAFGTKTIGGVSDTQYMVNQLGKAMQIVPVSQEQFHTLVAQYAGTVRPMYRGKPEGQFISDTINYGVLMAQMGGQTRQGTQLASLLVQAMGAGSRTSKVGRADLATIQRVSGVSFVNKQGQITDPVTLMKALTGFATTKGVTPQIEAQYFQQAFKRTGASLAGLFAEPGVAQRFKVVADAMKAMPNLDAQQRAYNASPAGQFNQARKNFDSAMTTLGILWLPIATYAAHALASFTAGLVQMAQKHPQIMQFLAIFIALSAAVALVLGPLLMLAGVFAIVAAVGLPALLAAIFPIVIAFVALVAAIALVTLVILHWKDIFGSPNPNQQTSTGTPTAPPKGQTHGHWVQGTVGGRSGLRQWNWVPDPSTPVHAPPPPPHTRATGGGGYVPPGATVIVNGGIHPVIYAQPHQNPAEIAQNVIRDVADGIEHYLNGGASTARGLHPSLTVPG